MKSHFLFTLFLTNCSINLYAQSWTEKGLPLLGDSSYSNCGETADISSDGSTIAISNYGSGDAGTVAVYTWDSSAWVKKGVTLNGTQAYQDFGTEVALSGDGNTLVVGSPRYSSYSALYENGKIEVFQWDGSSWQAKGAAFTGDYDNEKLGEKFDISKDGNVLAIGSKSNDSYGLGGVAWVYQYDGSIWQLKGNEFGGSNKNRSVGRSIAISDDGLVVAFGSRFRDQSNNTIGAVQINQWNGSSWDSITSVFGTEKEPLGSDVSLNSDGSVLATSSIESDSIAPSAGMAKVFSWDGSILNPMGSQLFGTDSFEVFGYDLDLNSDGETLIVSGYRGVYTSVTGPGKVKTYRYNNSSSEWEQMAQTLYGQEILDRFGRSVAIDSAGTSIIIGQPRHNANGTASGRVIVYELATPTTIQPNMSSEILYNNPVDELLKCTFNKKQSHISATLYNAAGQVVFNKNYSNVMSIEISMLDRPNGFYFLKLSGQNELSGIIQQTIKFAHVNR